MNKPQARREAHRAIAALIRVHLEFDDNDLTAVVNDWPEADATRFLDACTELADWHAWKGLEPSEK